MANPITVFNTDILTTISSVEYNGASGVNVDNENRLISLDENTLSAVSSVDNKLDISAYHEYSAGNNIDITDYEISGKDWTSDISNASSYAYNQATAQIPSLDGYLTKSSADTLYQPIGNYATTEEVSSVSADLSGAIDNKLSTSDFDTYSGVVNNQITALRHDLDTVSTNTGYLYNDLTSTSAGLSGAVDYVSGSLTSKQDKLTEEQLSAISSISSLDTKFYPLNENPSGYLVQSDLNDYATTSQTDYLSATITSNSADFSGAIDYLSGHAGKTYEGVLPISVDNTNNEISISSTPFSVQEPLYFVENTNTSVVVGFSGDTFTGARVNIPLTGDGTTANPLGLMNYISWGGNGTTSTFTRSGVRVLDENNNSAYYLASGLNLNNESITDSAISSWNDTKTTVETNSASWGAGSVSLPITGSSNNTTATYDSNSAMFDYIESQGEPTHIKISINPDPNEGGIKIYNSQDEDETNSTLTIGDGFIQFKDTEDNYNIIYGDNVATWDSTYNTVQSNSANWGGITSVDTNHGISGNGTTSTPIGIASSFQLENPSVYTTATYKGDSIGIEGMMPRIQLKTDNSSYNTLGEGGMTITHSASGVGGGYTTSHYGSTMRLSYNDGDYYLHTMDTTKSGLGVAYKANSNVKAYYNYSGVALTNDNGATNEYVNVSSIRNWNDVYDTVSSNSASWTGGGSTYTAGNGIDITNDVISVTGKQDSLTGEVQNGLDQVYTNSANWNNSMSGLFLAEYGKTSYDQVKSAVDANRIVYCLTGGRCAFLAFSASNNYEFQYYRSVNGHTDTQQGDEVFVYKITKNSGSGTWSITERNAFSRVRAGVGLSSTYTPDKITLGIKDISSYARNTDLQYVSGQVDDVYNKVSSNSSTWDTVTTKQDELTFGYDSNDAISSINNSAISDSRQGTDLYVQYPLFTGTSGTSAYIGWNNETVLFSASTPVVFGTDMTLSEPYSAFERIGIYNGHDCYGSFDSFRLSGDQDARIFTYYYPTNTASNVEFGVLRFSAVDANTIVACTNTNVTITTAGTITRQTNVNNYSMRTAKIVGINRIQ